MARFWAIRMPELSDYYQSFFVNGYVRYCFSLPGLDCPECDDCYGGSRVLPFECPKEFQQRKVLRKPQAIPFKEHCTLCSELENAFERMSVQIKLKPGDNFQPAFFYLQSLPTVDFFWAYAGPCSVIISERARTLFENTNVRGAFFSPTILRKIGRLTALPENLSELCPTGEVMEMLESAETVGEPSPYRFYDMIPSTEVGTSKLLANFPLCSLCGNPQVDWNEDPDPVEVLASEFVIDRDIADKIDLDFFFLADLGLVVSEKVRKIILEYKLSNCDLIPLSHLAR